MKLHVSKLKQGENAFHYESTKDSWLKDVFAGIAAKGYQIPGPAVADISITNMEPDYYVKGRLQFPVEQACARCAETFTMRIDHRFDLAYANVGPAHVRAASLSEESEELDVNYFNEQLELDPMIEEQFFLSLPYQTVCQENCKGLCATCGKNLNTGDCKCKPDTKFGPFSVLEQLKL